VKSGFPLTEKENLMGFCKTWARDEVHFIKIHNSNRMSTIGVEPKLTWYIACPDLLYTLIT